MSHQFSFRFYTVEKMGFIFTFSSVNTLSQGRHVNTVELPYQSTVERRSSVSYTLHTVFTLMRTLVEFLTAETVSQQHLLRYYSMSY